MIQCDSNLIKWESMHIQFGSKLTPLLTRCELGFFSAYGMESFGLVFGTIRNWIVCWFNFMTYLWCVCVCVFKLKIFWWQLCWAWKFFKNQSFNWVLFVDSFHLDVLFSKLIVNERLLLFFSNNFFLSISQYRGNSFLAWKIFQTIAEI